MKRLLFLLLLLVVAGILRSTAQTASFNFSLNPQSVSGWVNAHGDPSDTLITATAPSGITVSSVGATNWSRIAYTSDPCAYDGGGATGGTFFPAAVMLNHWFQYGTSTAAYNALLPQLVISNLNVDSVYTIKMTGSFVLGIPQYYTLNPMRYTVMGTINYGFIDIDGDSNTTAGAVFHNIAPDSTGKVRIFVNTYGGSNVASICGLQVTSGATTGVVPSVSLTKPTTGTILPEDANVAINATATETGGTIAEVQFYANSTLIGVDSTAPYSLTWIDPDPGTYTITARAIDGTGGITTSSANITIESLNYFWSTTGNIATGGDTSFVGTVDSNRLAFRTKNIERMTISAIGNIGIGTDSPTAQLHTTGSVRFAGLTSDSTPSRILVSDSTGRLYYQNIGSSGGTASRWLFTNGTVYDSVDNIAIGTNNPQGYKLAVNGAGIFTKIVAKPQSSWPDFVFDKGYNLPSLQELAQYIREHHHLPEVTAESEIMRNGIDLGQQQTTLLKKVEELTLYLIRENQSLREQNKQLADQNARLEAQQKEIDELKAMIQANQKK